MQTGGHGEGVPAIKKRASEKGPLSLSDASRSFVIFVGLLIPTVQLAADREHYRPMRVFDDDGGLIVRTRLTSIGERPMCGCAKGTVEKSGAKADVGVKDVCRVTGINRGVLETECRNECFKVETVSSPINFKAVGYIFRVAVQFKSVRYAGAVGLEHATTTGHASIESAGQWGRT